MEVLWFCLVAILIAGYVILDGFDLGAGIVHLVITRNDDDRRKILESIGPFWDGNEVWLLAAGGTLFFAFPVLYASSFMGFYLPLMIVLWLLMIRGLSIELRGHSDSNVWRPLWDAGFAGSSALLAVFFGAALGNVVRGVPLDSNGEFFLPLWTNFLPGKNPGVLDLYTLLTGITALAVLGMHGALWVSYKTSAPLQTRARDFARSAWLVTVVLTAVLTITTFWLRPYLWANFVHSPWGVIFPALAFLGLAAVFRGLHFKNDLSAFLGSCAYIGGMLTSVVFSVFPYVLPSSTDLAQSLTIYNTTPGAYGHRVGLMWWIPAMLLTAGYFFFLYRKFRGKVE